MYKSIFIAAFLCAGCADYGADSRGGHTVNIYINPADGGKVSRDPEGPFYKTGETVTLTAAANPGYEFAGWTGAPSGTANVITLKMDGGAELTANFRPRTSNTYTVTFDANGGNGAPPNSYTVNAGSAITLPNEDSLTKTGYDFDGWNTDSSGAGADYGAGSSYTPDSSVTLYAKWTNRSETRFTDSRDGKIYKKAALGAQVWMAENLNYDIPGDTTDVCYGNSADSCAKYGRLYNWDAALTACPAGWHLPSDAEWTALVEYAGGAAAGTKLKSRSYWNIYDGVSAGTDAYGFSALPGGYGYDGGFSNAGNYGDWWSATERNAGYAWNRSMYFGGEGVGRGDDSKAFLFSVRCVQSYLDSGKI